MYTLRQEAAHQIISLLLLTCRTEIKACGKCTSAKTPCKGHMDSARSFLNWNIQSVIRREQHQRTNFTLNRGSQSNPADGCKAAAEDLSKRVEQKNRITAPGANRSESSPVRHSPVSPASSHQTALKPPICQASLPNAPETTHRVEWPAPDEQRG